MADAFTGEIRLFGGNFIPYQWAACNGDTLSIQQYSVLFSIIGITYGGNGTTNFMLPNLNGRVPLHQGAGPGLTPRELGDDGGAASVTLQSPQMPLHNHVPMALAATGNTASPAGAVWAQAFSGGRNPAPIAQFTSVPNVTMPANTLAPTGGSEPHNNMQPYLPLQFIICMVGEFPSRP